MNCDDVLQAIAAGHDPDRDATQIEAHLAVCPSCRLQVRQMQALGDALRDPLLWEDPPGDLEERVVAALAPEPRHSRRLRPWWVAGAAAAVLILVVAMVASLNRPDWTVELVAGADAPGASAVVSGWNRGDGTRMVLDTSGLPGLGQHSYYEVWMTAPDGHHISAGTFSETGRVTVSAAVRRAEYPRIWVTREPDDGDPAPFPAVVLDTPGEYLGVNS
ncbi:MAG: anti-sigma factor [Acidimicrobiia bacterium]